MQRLPFRADIPLRVLAIWAAFSACLFLILGAWTLVIVLYSAPIAGLAVVISTLFARNVARRPILWTAAAIISALTIGCFYFHNAGILSLLVSVPAGCAFLASLRLWPVVQIQNGSPA